jgi:hypothetical protein
MIDGANCHNLHPCLPAEGIMMASSSRSPDTHSVCIQNPAMINCPWKDWDSTRPLSSITLAFALSHCMWIEQEMLRLWRRDHEECDHLLSPDPFKVFENYSHEIVSSYMCRHQFVLETVAFLKGITFITRSRFATNYILKSRLSHLHVEGICR